MKNTHPTPDQITPAPLVAVRSHRVVRRGIAGAAAALVLILVFLLLNTQRIIDELAVAQFHPGSVATALAESPNLTAEGRRLFLSGAPTISNAKDLNAQCAKKHEGSGILGCYQPFTRSIHLFAVTDSRLAGLDSVTAAHEMLHAAWDRMNSAQQADLKPLLEVEAKKLTKDPEFGIRMAYYAKNEPGERTNELHSIVATEAVAISPALEKHYKSYFTNRAAIVADYARTNLVFSELTTKITTLSARMVALNTDIEAQYSTYNSDYNKLNADIDSFNATTGWTSQSSFNAAAAVLHSREATLDATFADVEKKSASYLADYDELSKLVSQTAELSTAVNLAPPKLLAPAPK